MAIYFPDETGKRAPVYVVLPERSSWGVAGDQVLLLEYLMIYPFNKKTPTHLGMIRGVVEELVKDHQTICSTFSGDWYTMWKDLVDALPELREGEIIANAIIAGSFTLSIEEGLPPVVIDYSGGRKELRELFG